MANTKKALISNKDDTASAIALAGAFYENVKKMEQKLAMFEKQLRGSRIFANIIVPIPGLMLITRGFIDLGFEKYDSSKAYITSGLITLVGMELVYQGGHWFFKVW